MVLLPSPLWGGVGGGGRRVEQDCAPRHDPPPRPSPTRGEGERRRRARRDHPPHKGRAIAWFCSPPPCGEGSGVGVDEWSRTVPRGTTPHPDPPPQGGREKGAAVPDAITLPTRAGRSHGSAPLPLVGRGRGWGSTSGARR